MNQGIKDIKIYQISYQLAIDIHKATLEFPKIEQYGGIADQLRRSSKSITANIVEGFGKIHIIKVNSRGCWFMLLVVVMKQFCG